MVHRIITHLGCLDGYSSAFMVKKFFKELTGKEISEEELKDIDVVGTYPGDVQTESFEFHEDDIVVDLPQPLTKVFFWADHHLTSKPKEEKNNYFWKEAPSCSGFLIELAEEKGATLSDEIKRYKETIDKIDTAEYSAEEIKECYHLQNNYDNPTDLQKAVMVLAMIHTNDNYLNQQVLKTLLTINLGETPVEGTELQKLNPMMFYRAQLEGFAIWRKEVDEYIYYDEEHDCVVQDDRKVKFTKGLADRFYAYTKFPEANYNVRIKPIERDLARISVNCNIFHKDWCMLDIGLLCANVGKKFGEKSGGGHYTVGGAIINLENSDKALKYILEKLKEADDEADLNK